MFCFGRAFSLPQAGLQRLLPRIPSCLVVCGARLALRMYCILVLTTEMACLFQASPVASI